MTSYDNIIPNLNLIFQAFLEILFKSDTNNI